MLNKKIKKVSIYNNFSPNYHQKRQSISNLLRKNDFITLAKGDLVLVIGGDGTFLSAVKEKWRDNPIFALVNDGNLGFFSEYQYSHAAEYIRKIKEEDYYIEEIPLYDFEIHHTDGKIMKDVFLNDLTIKQQGSKVIHFDLNINNENTIPYSCDGVVISSYIGSTAYNKSLNSSVIIDKLPSFQITPIAPVRNKRYLGITQAIIIGDKNTIEIIPSHKKRRQTLVVADNKEFQIKRGIKKVIISNKNHKIRILRTKDFDYRKNIINKAF